MTKNKDFSILFHILDKPFSENLYNEIHAIAGEWFVNLSAKQWGEKSYKEVTPEQEKIQCYIYSWHIFASRNIPFGLWSEVAKEGLALLREMLETGNLDYESNPKYEKFMKHFYECSAKIRAIPEYSERFGMGF